MQCLASAAACLDSLYLKFKKCCCLRLTKVPSVGPGIASIVHCRQSTRRWAVLLAILMASLSDTGTLPIWILCVIQWLSLNQTETNFWFCHAGAALEKGRYRAQLLLQGLRNFTMQSRNSKSRTKMVAILLYICKMLPRSLARRRNQNGVDGRHITQSMSLAFGDWTKEASVWFRFRKERIYCP